MAQSWETRGQLGFVAWSWWQHVLQKCSPYVCYIQKRKHLTRIKKCLWSVTCNESQLSYLLPLKFRGDIIFNCVDTITDVEAETDAIKNTLVSPTEKCAARSWVNNDYTDTRQGGVGRGSGLKWIILSHPVAEQIDNTALHTPFTFSTVH
jgi:hypothetical protein